MRLFVFIKYSFYRYRISSYDSIRLFLFYFQSESIQCFYFDTGRDKKRIFSLALGMKKKGFEVPQSHLSVRNLKISAVYDSIRRSQEIITHKYIYPLTMSRFF